MIDSLKHRRFGLFGTERTGAGIIKIRTIRPSPPNQRGSAGRVRNPGKVEAGAGPEEATVPAIFAFSDPRACRCTRMVTARVNESPAQDTGRVLRNYSLARSPMANYLVSGCRANQEPVFWHCPRRSAGDHATRIPVGNR